MDDIKFVTNLLTWYNHHHRTLPWRQTKDPYKIWLSEIILQQTRVAQGLPYYEKMVANYPSCNDLANTSEESLLHLWQGLGYYSRARNLHKCAQHIVHKLKGIFPTSYDALLQLPGIGPYTAAAVASTAFGEQVAAIDGNVYRVLARIFGIEENIFTSSGKKAFHSLANRLIPPQNPGIYNQALMEFGALHCTPHQPKCTTCPFQLACFAFHQNRQRDLPLRTSTLKVKKRYLYYIILHFEKGLYVKKRTPKDIWQGLYDFYLIERDEKELPIHTLEDPMISQIKSHNLMIKPSNCHLSHKLTHQQLYARFFHVNITTDFLTDVAKLMASTNMRPVHYERLKEIPFPKLIHRFFALDTPLSSMRLPN